jgi:ferredoxin--NADP+ reductase
VANYLRRVLESPDVSFLGGVRFGEDVTREELLGAYDAVVYATGAMRDRRLGIPGEDLPGSYAATDFVNWYCGHPDLDPSAFVLNAESAVVVGVGNVAVDVARILARDVNELHATDIPEPVLDVLRASSIREVHVIGRRGPAYAKFTTKELRELGELPGVSVSVEADEMDLGTFDASGESATLAESDRRVRGNLVAMRDWLSPSAGSGRKLRVRFWLRPVEILESSSGTAAGVSVERTRLSAEGKFEGTGEIERIDAQLVLRSVGYQSVPLPDVPFDQRSCTVPNAGGRVLDEAGQPLPGEYVAGWLKRGPTGVIGTNKSDAAETVRSLLADLAGGPGPSDVQLPRAGLLRMPEVDAAAAGGGSPLAPILAERNRRHVSYPDWLRIEAAERELAARLGRGARVKLASREDLDKACGLL